MYLGINIEPKLIFIEHISSINKKLSRFWGLVYKATLYFSKTQLLHFYTSYAESVIFYGFLVYGNTYKTHLEETQVSEKDYENYLF